MAILAEQEIAWLYRNKARKDKTMRQYRVGIWEEISGYINVEAESEEKAKELAEELMDAHGAEVLFLPPNGKCTHGMREVVDCDAQTT